LKESIQANQSLEGRLKRANQQGTMLYFKTFIAQYSAIGQRRPLQVCMVQPYHRSKGARAGGCMQRRGQGQCKLEWRQPLWCFAPCQQY